MQRARELHPEAGFSLIELIVAMAILTVLSTIVIGTYVSTVKVMGTANAVNVNSEQASNAMNESARQIRAATSNPVASTSGSVPNAPAIVAAGTDSVTLYAYVNLQSSSIQQPEQVRLRVDPTTRQFKEDIWPGTQSSAGYWTFPATTTTPSLTRTLAGFVAPHVGAATTSNPYVFTYLAGGTALTVPTTGPPWTPAQFNSITAIQITLTVETNITTATQSVTLQNTVGMPNLNE
jgi:prepilin-type N-terminal cleavage/methylation domain-containing protein